MFGKKRSFNAGAGTLLFAFVSCASYLMMPIAQLITTDSTQYIAAASSLAAQSALRNIDGSVFLLWPPLMPLLLSISFFLHIPVLTFAAVLYGIAFGAVALVTFLIVFEYAQARWLALSCGLFLVIWKPLVAIYSHAWSEPFFLLWFSLSLLAYVHWRRTGHRNWLGLLVACCWLLTMTRYSGIFLTFGFAAAIVLTKGERLKKRFLTSVLFCSAALIPMVIWSARNHVVGDPHSTRPFFLKSIGISRFYSLFNNTLKEPLYGDSFAAVKMLAAVLMVAGFLGVFRYLRRGRDAFFAIALCGAATVIGLSATILFVDRAVTFEERQLIPLTYCLYLTMTCGLYLTYRRFSAKRTVRFAGVLFAVLLIGSTVYGWNANVRRLRGMVRAQNEQYATVKEFVAFIPDDTVIYTNIPDTLYMATGRRALWIPVQFSVYRDMAHPAYEQNKGLMMRALGNGAVIVYLTQDGLRDYLMPAQDIRAIPDVRVLKEQGPLSVFAQQGVQ